MAAGAAIGMILSMFAPWWQRPSGTRLSNSASAGISQVSFIELAIVLVAAAVALMLYRRAGQREFHLPLSDGTLAAIAGAWCAFLIVFRIFNPPGIVTIAGDNSEYDPRWGIFVTFLLALLLLASGVRGRRRYHSGESEAVAADEDAVPAKTIERQSHLA